MKKLLFLILFLVPAVFAESQPVPIPVDEAFQFSATAKDYQTIIGIWNIKPGFYLYRDRIHFSPITPKQNRLAQPLWPKPNTYKDFPDIGKLAVYTGNLRIPVPIINSTDKTIFLHVSYQGCSEAGYCYPPITKTVQINLAGNYMRPVSPLAVDIAPEMTMTTTTASTKLAQISPQQLLEHKNIFTILVTFLGFGLLLSLTPCVLPMIPILSGIIVGQQGQSHPRAFLLSVMYVLGMAITYAIAGIIFGFIGGTVQAAFQKPWVIILFSLVFVAMALSLFGLYQIQLPDRWRAQLAKISNQQKRGSYVGAAIMGCLSTLIASPCVTPPLVGALGYISQTGNAGVGGLALFVMGIGMGVPLLLIGAFGAKYLPKAGSWMNTIKIVLGVLLLAVAIWMLSRILPGFVSVLLWAALLFGSAVALPTFSSAKNKRQIVGKIIGVALFVYGIILVVGAFLGNNDPLRPWHFVRASHPINGLTFTPVKTVEDVQRQLQTAKAQHQPVMLDFYADWCISCKEMERFTFSNRNVQQALHRFRLLRADVTRNDDEDKRLEQYFHVVAPPTILFFDENGHEIPNLRVIGEMSARAFLKHLRKNSQ